MLCDEQRFSVFAVKPTVVTTFLVCQIITVQVEIAYIRCRNAYLCIKHLQGRIINSRPLLILLWGRIMCAKLNFLREWILSPNLGGCKFDQSKLRQRFFRNQYQARQGEIRLPRGCTIDLGCRISIDAS